MKNKKVLKRVYLGCLSMIMGAVASAAQAHEYNFERVLQAPIDESYFGPGDSRNVYDPYSDEHPLPGGIAKRNGGYAWGTTVYKDKVWYGAFMNGWCSVWLFPAGLPPLNDSNQAIHNYQSDRNACNVTDNEKTPVIQIFDSKTQQVKPYRSDNPVFNEEIKQVAAIRSAGTWNNVVFIAGLLTNENAGGDMSPDNYFWKGIRIFAFDGDTEEYLGSTLLDDLNEIRRMKILEHPDGSQGLYVAASSRAGDSYILRWTGNEDDLFSKKSNNKYPGFDIVIDNSKEGLIGEFELNKSENGEHRIVATTWSSWPVVNRSGGLLVSSSMPKTGFSASKPGQIKPIMLLEDFDPDSFMAPTWGAGALSLYKGYAYWGTMTIGTAYVRAYFDHSESMKNTPEARDSLVRANYARAGHVFRTDLSQLGKVKDLAEVKTEMLYGNEFFPVYNESKGAWGIEKNSMGLKPKHGPAGFGYGTNNYTWVSTVHDDKLFLSTFDYSGGLEDYVENSEHQPPEHDYLIHSAYRVAKEQGGYIPGGDLVVFEDADSPAKIITRSGLDNPDNNGFRNFLVVEGELYIGTSSESNIGENAGYMWYKLRDSSGK